MHFGTCVCIFSYNTQHQHHTHRYMNIRILKTHPLTHAAHTHTHSLKAFLLTHTHTCTHIVFWNYYDIKLPNSPFKLSFFVVAEFEAKSTDLFLSLLTFS